MCDCLDCSELDVNIGQPGENGQDGMLGSISDSNNTINNVRNLTFTDTNVEVTEDPEDSGNVFVSFNPVTSHWEDIENLSYYTAGSELFKPQYLLEGNKIYLRGRLFIPLSNDTTPVSISNGNSYLEIHSVDLDETKMTIVNNSNGSSENKQGRFLTTSVTTHLNFPSEAIPQQRDIVFNNVQATRRIRNGTGTRINLYRTFVTLRIGSMNTVYNNSSSQLGIGCLSVFSISNEQIPGIVDNLYSREDVLSLLVTNVSSDSNSNNYTDSTDNTPFTISSSGNNPYVTCNAHNINNLGGFYIDLDGLYGFIN